MCKCICVCYLFVLTANYLKLKVICVMSQVWQCMSEILAVRKYRQTTLSNMVG